MHSSWSEGDVPNFLVSVWLRNQIFELSCKNPSPSSAWISAVPSTWLHLTRHITAIYRKRMRQCPDCDLIVNLHETTEDKSSWRDKPSHDAVVHILVANKQDSSAIENIHVSNLRRATEEWLADSCSDSPVFVLPSALVFCQERWHAFLLLFFLSLCFSSASSLFLPPFPFVLQLSWV